MPGRPESEGLSEAEWVSLRRVQMALFGEFLDLGDEADIAGRCAEDLGKTVRFAVRASPDETEVLSVVRGYLANRVLTVQRLEEVCPSFERAVLEALNDRERPAKH